MGITNKQYQSFIDATIIPNIDSAILDYAIDWIKGNLEIEDVFDRDKIVDWATTHSPDEIFNEDVLTKWAKDQEPDEVCHMYELERWATRNGYEMIPGNKA